MSAGLEASTVTPGSTPPEVSLTTPARVAWANAEAGSRLAAAANSIHLLARVAPRIGSPSTRISLLRFLYADQPPSTLAHVPDRVQYKLVTDAFGSGIGAAGWGSTVAQPNTSSGLHRLPAVRRGAARLVDECDARTSGGGRAPWRRAS